MQKTKKEVDFTNSVFKEDWEKWKRGELKTPRLKEGFWVDGVRPYPINCKNKTLKKSK
jgi:hypothetical protein